MQLQTERLIIRRFVPEDGQGLFDYISDEEVVRYEPYPPPTLEECRQWAKDRAKSESFWAVCLRESGALIGNLYLAKREQEGWELGYVFGRTHWGNGYATEAAKALLDWLFAQHKAHRIIAMCNPLNRPSWRLMERLGMRREGHLIKNVAFHNDVHGKPLWQDTYLYAILREEWRADDKN
ncbi:MAG: GNAT family N-acetyltransferase [Oscillospiraceae bacterium]